MPCAPWRGCHLPEKCLLSVLVTHEIWTKKCPFCACSLCTTKKWKMSGAIPTSHRNRSPFCTMVHSTGWWCTIHSYTIDVVHNVALTNPDFHMLTADRGLLTSSFLPSWTPKYVNFVLSLYPDMMIISGICEPLDSSICSLKVGQWLKDAGCDVQVKTTNPPQLPETDKDYYYYYFEENDMNAATTFKTLLYCSILVVILNIIFSRYLI